MKLGSCVREGGGLSLRLGGATTEVVTWTYQAVRWFGELQKLLIGTGAGPQEEILHKEESPGVPHPPPACRIQDGVLDQLVLYSFSWALPFGESRVLKGEVKPAPVKTWICGFMDFRSVKPGWHLGISTSWVMQKTVVSLPQLGKVPLLLNPGDMLLKNIICVIP